MSDLDIILAKEYAKRHGLYDKSSPKYKDRLYMENAWQEMSNLLGYDVSVLKDRMLQLRNRYNVEKRKFELLRLQNPNAKSPWPLYNHFSFLDGHIRQRRKTTMGGYYVTLEDMKEEANKPPPMKRRPGRPPKSSYANNEPQVVQYDHKPTPHYISKHITNNENTMSNQSGSLEQYSRHSENIESIPIKEELVSNPDEDAVIEDNPEQYINPANLLAQAEESGSEESQNSNTSSEKEQRNGLPQPVTSSERRHNDLILKLHRRPCKFQAFGQFLTAALADMPEDKALSLIEQFTIELVTKMKSSSSSSTS